MAETIFFEKAKGGAGATACALGLGFALAADGERVLYLDGDFECADGAFCAGVNGLNVYSLGDVEKGACRVKQAVLQHPKERNLYILPSLGCANERAKESAIREIEGLFDFVLCDGSAAGACESAILVSRPYPQFLNSAKKAVARLKDGRFKDVKLIVNAVNGGLVFDGEILSPQEIATLLRCENLGVIPDDPLLPLGKTRGDTLAAFEVLADNLRGRQVKNYKILKRYIGLKGFMRRKLRTEI